MALNGLTRSTRYLMGCWDEANVAHHMGIRCTFQISSVHAKHRTGAWPITLHARWLAVVSFPFRDINKREVAVA